MITPLYQMDYFGTEISLLIAVLLGFGFGFFLERGGLGDAKKLSGQFYLKDFTVFKVMFTAIVTAGIGVYWLTNLGFLDLTLVFVNPTYLYPQLAGGLIFGFGFVIGGLCPGTSCVSASTGKLDGLALLLGIFGGIFIFAETNPLFDEFFSSGYMGRITLPELFGINDGGIILFVILIAIAGFIILQRAETRKIDIPLQRNKSFSGRFNHYIAAAGLSLACLAFLSGNSYEQKNYPEWDFKNADNNNVIYISPVKLAEKIIRGDNDFQLVDLRTEEEFNEYHLPGAIHYRDTLKNDFKGSTILYSNGQELSDYNSGTNLTLLFGGIILWKEMILYPDLNKIIVDKRLAKKIENISRYFGGKPRSKVGAPWDKRKANYRDGC